MSRVAYVNGQYVPHGEASVHIEDRGYQFADGIYEVCEVRDGAIIDMGPHLDRLERSAHELQMKLLMGRKAMAFVINEIRTRNRVNNGLIYIQVSRGVAPRNHLFPGDNTPLSVVMTARYSSRKTTETKAEKGVSVITVPDNRWDRVDIKTVSLLPNVLAKQKAKENGAYEAWFVDDDGMVTEGSSTNAWIVTQDDVLVTRPAQHGILKGITRSTVLKTAEKLQVKIEERKFSVEEALNAKEAFITAATTIVVPIIEMDRRKIGAGIPGDISKRLRSHFYENVS